MTLAGPQNEMLTRTKESTYLVLSSQTPVLPSHLADPGSSPLDCAALGTTPPGPPGHAHSFSQGTCKFSVKHVSNEERPVRYPRESILQATPIITSPHEGSCHLSNLPVQVGMLLSKEQLDSLPRQDLPSHPPSTPFPQKPPPVRNWCHWSGHNVSAFEWHGPSTPPCPGS